MRVGLVLGGATAGQAYLTAEAVAQGASTPRWVHLLTGTVALIIGVGVNLMTELIFSSSDVVQLVERAPRGAHHCHKWDGL